MVGGNPQSLARAERELGLASWAVSLHPAPQRYPTDEILCPEGTGKLLTEVRRWQLLGRALRDFDIVHFNFGQSFMPEWVPPTKPAGGGLEGLARQAYRAYLRAVELRDLPWLKRLGKGIVVTYQGDDARQGDASLARFAISAAQVVEPGYYTPAWDAHKRQRIATMARYADRIYALNPDLLHVLPPSARFLPYASIDLDAWRMVEKPWGASDRPVVLHAPTHRGVKGTPQVLEAVRRLQEEGVDFEFVLIEGMTHAEARRAYERADLLVDQLFCGWYGGLALELMALGKAVICYLREEDLAFLPAGMREDLPILNATSETLYHVLKDWLTVRRHALGAQGRLGRAFAERWHDPRQIAAQLGAEYQRIMAAKRGSG